MVNFPIRVKILFDSVERNFELTKPGQLQKLVEGTSAYLLIFERIAPVEDPVEDILRTDAKILNAFEPEVLAAGFFAETSYLSACENEFETCIELTKPNNSAPKSSKTIRLVYSASD